MERDQLKVEVANCTQFIKAGKLLFGWSSIEEEWLGKSRTGSRPNTFAPTKERVEDNEKLAVTDGYIEEGIARKSSCSFGVKKFILTRTGEIEMASNIDVDDILDAVDIDDSEYDTSDDEYTPNSSEESEIEDEPAARRAKPPKAKKRRSCPADTDDDIPLAVLRDRIRESREEDFDSEMLSEMLDSPMWAELPLGPTDTAFKGPIEQLLTDGLQSPYEFFRLLITDNMLEHVERQTNLYAMSKSGIELKTTAKEIEVFIGLYLRMGLMKSHCVRAYWSWETRYPPVAEEMSRNRFELLARHIHFCENTSLTDEQKAADRVWKVRPWLGMLRTNLEKIIPLQDQSVDEIMVAFKGRSGLKQYIRNKPRKWGFKLWARAGSDGILHDFDVYQGKRDTDNSNRVGMGGNVVLEMTRKLPTDANFRIYADNLFSGLALVNELRDRGMWYVGTVRENRLKGCNLKSEKHLKKEKRGAVDSKLEVNSNTVVVRWMDNRKVDLISSFVGVEPITTVNRYDKKRKQFVEVECPAIVKMYNKNMGGVDLLDSLTALYKFGIKSRRWYLYIFYHTINMAVVNSWNWYRRHCSLLAEKSLQLSDFQSNIASCLINVKKVPGRPAMNSPLTPKPAASSTNEQVPFADVRLDSVGHLPEWTTRGRCKAPSCQKLSFVVCTKCKTHLCFNKDRNCFKDFHSNK
ncbi:piggyBac transposable element-derived protein 2-like [Liolophura sinensis]|uniref:piggyBac transposable element-derived protein 2-like n=1 Tax=Liolophura sinensis TaxID=3198878 RepID=UPI003159608A